MTAWFCSIPASDFECSKIVSPMQRIQLIRIALTCAALGASPAALCAQSIEIVGSRALGMGGAFVAVASDASATWWNPAGLGPGPLLDLAVARTLTEQPEGADAWRAGASWIALATPPLGLSYYRFRITDIQGSGSTDTDAPDREEGGAGLSVRSLAVSQLGVTVLRTIVPGVHTGTTLKYVRAALRAAPGVGSAASKLLDEGEALEGGDADGQFDLDVGIIAMAGALRLGAVARNVREPEFDGVRLPRQYRVGVAVDPELIGGVPLTVALDADVMRYAAIGGERKVVALGAEQWLFQKRLGVRAGGRLNTVGSRGRSVTAGISVAPRGGLFLEGHVVHGGDEDEEGWGLAARVSF
jgi:hypothetical protein